MILSGAKFLPKSSKIERVVIMLHGLGADGNNLIDMAEPLSEFLPNTVFLAPNAPFAFDMSPDVGGYQWFSLFDWSPKSMLSGANKAAPILNQYIDEVLEYYNLTEDKLALIGFSQGTMMALHVAPTRVKKISAIIGFSGALISEETIKKANSKPDICLIHGQLDMVVPIAAMYSAKQILEKNGFKVSEHAIPYLDHSINMNAINIAGKFLKALM